MDFSDFVGALARAEIEFPHLKVAQLAQAILESGRGASELFRDHNNPFGMKYRPEVAHIAAPVAYTDHAGETDQYCAFASHDDAVRGYWDLIDRDPYTGWRHAASSPLEYLRFITFAGYLGGPHASVPPESRAADRRAKNGYVRSLRRLFEEAEGLLETAAARPGGQGPGMVPRRNVYLDVGHGAKPGVFDPGAIHGPSGTTEHHLNLVAAAACQAELARRGAHCRVDDSRKSNTDAGRAAVGFDVFVSVHHNAHTPGARAQGTEFFVHSSKHRRRDRQLGRSASATVARELGIPDRGLKMTPWDVLTGAHDAGVRAAVLAEMYFIHRQSPADPEADAFEEWSRRSGEAMAQAIAAWLDDNP